MSRGMVFVALLAMVLGAAGCETSRRIASRGDLADLSAAEPITVYAQDHRVYELVSHTLADSTLWGSGTVRSGSDRTPFDGRIPISSIVAVRTNSPSALKALLAVGAGIAFVAAVAGDGDVSAGLHSREDVHYVPPPSGGGGTSCPYVYAWDGARYVLEAEPFGAGLGRALELTTFHLLPSARAGHGVVRLRLTNERQETHYVNSVRMFAIDLGAAPAAVLDDDGTAWPVARPQAPVTASERPGRDILAEVASADGQMWECAAGNLAPGSGYEDVLELTFARPHPSGDGTLVITGTNTLLSTAMYGRLSRAMGDQAVELAHAIETDPELIARLRDYLDDASLQVTVWNGRAWEAAGAIRPEANAVTFTRGLRIHVPAGAGETARIRLRSMADAWELDAIALDWTDASPLPITPLRLVSARGPGGEELRAALGADDGRYAILLPPDRVELGFAASRRAGRARVAYAVAACGHLHEWVSEPADAGAVTAASMVPAARRLDVLKELLKHREAFLQPAYDAWAKSRPR